MPHPVSKDQIDQIKALGSTKSVREIATMLNLGKSTVSRHLKQDDTIRLVISKDEVEMPIERETANTFLSEIGIKPPLPRLESTVPESSPLKNNPKALRLAEMLAGIDKKPVSRRIVMTQREQPATPPQEVVVAPADNATLIAQIQMNAEHFEPVLKHLLVPDKPTFLERLYKKSNDELTTLLTVIEKARLLGNLTNQFKFMFFGASSALEMGTKLVGLKTDGLEAALRQQTQEVESILKEIALSKLDSWSGSQSPEIRLAYLVSATVLSVDTANRVRLLKKSPVATETFKDL